MGRSVLISSAAMLIWVLQLLLNPPAGFAATEDAISKMQCRALSSGVALSEHAANAYAELIQSLDPKTLRSSAKLRPLNRQQILGALLDKEDAFLTLLSRDPALQAIRWTNAVQSDDSSGEISPKVFTFFAWVTVGIEARLRELKLHDSSEDVSWNMQISLVRLSELLRQTYFQNPPQFIKNYDLSTTEIRDLIEAINRGRLEFTDRTRSQEVADQIIRGRLSRPLVPPGRHSLGTIVSINRSLSIFEQNQLLPLPILTIDTSGDPVLGLEDFEPSVRRWIREIQFFDATHSINDLINMRWYEEAFQVQRSYQNARNTKGKIRERLVIDWVFHTIVARSDSRFAQGPGGISALIARIGEDTQEQISFTDYILPRLRSPSALGPNTTLEEVLVARDALLIAFEKELRN